MNIRRILTSFLVIGVAGAAVVAATTAFFSDTETSEGNVLSAGSIDLTVEGFFENEGPNGFELPEGSTAFFAFQDLKPGDSEGGRVEMSATSNPYWACVMADNIENDENDVVEPEQPDSGPDGELANYLQILLWQDDGDGNYETGEQVLGGSPILASSLTDTPWLPLADSSNSGPFGNTPLDPEETYSLGMQYCFGEFSGDFLTCNGLGDDQNDAQTDSLEGDLSFYAVQSRNNNDFLCGDLEAETSQTIVIDGTDDLFQGDRFAAAAARSPQWFFYNDETDVIDNSLGSFVLGPETPVYPGGSAQMTVSGNQRKNIATYQFNDIKLADIDEMSFGTYSQSAGNGSPASERAPYLHFNVDFDNTDTWQRRLVFVPGNNGAVVNDEWQTWNAIDNGNALWVYSGATWPVTGQPGTTPKTWTQILADYPNAETRSTDSWLGIRVGEPYADGFTGNVDFFSITVNGVEKTFDFDN